MRIVLIGAVDFSLSALQLLIELDAQVVGVVSKRESRFNADYAPLAPLCAQHSIPVLYSSKLTRPDKLQWLRDKAPDAIFCWGWSHLLPPDVLELPPRGVVGYHPAALPQNRGRHPLIWALALGLKHTASTFFFLDAGTDSGDILSQRRIPILYQDDAASLYRRMTETALAQIREFLPQLQEQRAPRVAQDHSQANSWRKRGPADGRIDLRMGSKQIYDLVRALTRPYVGAHLDWAGNACKVWRVRELDLHAPNIEPGKVLRVEGAEISVRCGVGSLAIVEHELHPLPGVGDYL